MKKRILITALTLIFFSLLSNVCFSQQPALNLETNRLFKIQINGVTSFKKADLIAREMEKMQLAVFSYVDSATGTGLFIVDNIAIVPQIENQITSISGCSSASSEEITFNEDAFLGMYMKRGGITDPVFSNSKPNFVAMGFNTDLANVFFNTALMIWDKSYGNVYKNRSQGLPDHYPRYANTGNSESDANKFEQLKQEWIKNYPEESKNLTNTPSQEVKSK